MSRILRVNRARLRPRDSVLDCGSPLPLCHPDPKSSSPRRAGAALWRAAKAEGLAQFTTWRRTPR